VAGYTRRLFICTTALQYTLISQSYGASLDHSVTCLMTEVNTPHLNPSHIGRYSI